MSYKLSNLLQDSWYRMGQVRRWKATGGSATSFINTLWAGVEEPFYEDDDPALIYGTAVVMKTDNELAPQGEWGMITDYDSSTQTLTIDSLTAAIQSGDLVGIVSPLFPVEDMIKLANIALQRLGEVEFPDLTLTTVAGKTEYSLPLSISKKPVRVRIQTNSLTGNFHYKIVPSVDTVPNTMDNTWTLVIPESVSANFKLEVIYRSPHPEASAFDSTILDVIHPELAICSLVAEAYQWYNNQTGGSNQYFLQRENKSLQDLEAAMVKHPIEHTIEQVNGFVHWRKDSRYVPLTSDLRY